MRVLSKACASASISSHRHQLSHALAFILITSNSKSAATACTSAFHGFIWVAACSNSHLYVGWHSEFNIRQVRRCCCCCCTTVCVSCPKHVHQQASLHTLRHATVHPSPTVTPRLHTSRHATVHPSPTVTPRLHISRYTTVHPSPHGDAKAAHLAPCHCPPITPR